ncbi:zinc transporter ZntB [Glaciecola sp. MH2013]|uniref:zinc transporter ZntB n=1 Tax=Glaciecola sp. MH2013 TaxID=2785524 RepID=UPI00189CB82D|nr:zinc transporter ZntB [Glaciecola sp. MH2013]MBF7073138.1 zinc transporter ZntB [Glaciecola sp. MH2013]
MSDLQDTQSLLWNLQVNDLGHATEADSDIKPSRLPENSEQNHYQWIHIQADVGNAKDILESVGLSELTSDSMTAIETRPKAFAADGGVMLFLRGINLNQNAEEEDMVSLRLWFDRNNIISARRKDRKLLSVQKVRSLIDSKQCISSPAELVLELIENIAEGICDTVDRIDDELSAFEADDGLQNHDRLKLSRLRRKAASIRRYLAPQRDALDALFRLNKVLTQAQFFELRELTDRMTRYVEDLDLAKERAMLLQDELRNRIADQQGVRMYVLSLVTAIFLPLSFLTGLFGMNVAGLPGVENPNGFFIVGTTMVVLAVLMLAGMLWKRWL